MHYFIHKIYGIQVNIRCDLHTSFWFIHLKAPILKTGVVQVGQVKVTPDIDSMKYKGTFFSYAYILKHLYCQS